MKPLLNPNVTLIAEAKTGKEWKWKPADTKVRLWEAFSFPFFPAPSGKGKMGILLHRNGARGGGLPGHFFVYGGRENRPLFSSAGFLSLFSLLFLSHFPLIKESGRVLK